LATAAVVAATLTLATAVIGLIKVLADDSGGSGGRGNRAASTVTEPEESGDGNRGEGATSEAGELQLDPSHDGNSRATAKRVEANQPIEASLVAGNDMDWYVYHAPKAETVTIKFVEGEGELGYGGVIVTVSEGLEQVENHSVGITESLTVRRIVAPGARLFVRVEDICSGEGGCGIGPYNLLVRTAPPG